MTMAWVGIGSAVVGAAGQYMAADRARSASGGPPQALPGPTSPGGINTDMGGWWRDPYTGMVNQTNWSFDPTGMGQQLDASMMWNQFMGRDNSNQLNDLNWQIQQLQQNLERLSNPQTGANRATQADDFGVGRFIGEDGKLQDISDTNAIWDGRINTPAGRALIEQFRKDTGGNYGGTGPKGFGKWVRDFYQRSLQPKFEEYKKTSATQEGNQQVNQRAIQDLQNQIGYLTQQRDRVTNYQASENPMSKYLTDLGPEWKTKDNTNPWADEWGTLTGKKIAGADDDPWADMERFGLVGGGTSAEARLQALLSGQPQTPDYIDPNRLRAPEFDGTQAARLADAMNWRASEEFKNQGQAAEATAARRGMLNSSVLDMQDASRLESLVGSQKDAALKAAMLRDQLQSSNFGQQAQAAASYQNAVSANNAARNAFDANRFQGIGLLNSIGNQNYGNWLQGKNQNFQQAMVALDQANKMRSEDRSFDLQDYQIGQSRNQTGYQRAADMWNRLQGLTQQGFQNRMTQQGANTQAAGTFLPANMQMADWQNQSNLGNVQMQNAWQMGNQQRQAAADNANQQGWWNLAGTMAGAMGNYYANRPSGGGSGGNPNMGSASATGWDTGTPTWNWE